MYHYRFKSTAFLLGYLLLTVSPAWPQVSGVIREEGSDALISGALVSVQNTSSRTASASDGSFMLSDAAGFGLVIVAAKQGYYNASVPATSPATGIQIRLEQVPQDENADYDLLDPAVCRRCHPVQFLQWSGSAMSQAGSNAWVYDIYSGDGTAGGDGGFVYTRDSDHAASNVESECAACHQPELWIENPQSALDPVNNISAGATHGISCEVCHKVARVDEEKPNYPGIYPGVVTITRPDSAAHQVEYGVLADSDFDGEPEVMRASYQPQLKAELCAACHQDKNDPDQDGEFEESNGIISEPTYLEWLASPYSDPQSPRYATCVDCHMPSYGGTEVCQIGAPHPIRDPETIRSHRIEGTTPAFLENAVTLTISATGVGRDLEVDVEILNDKTGHHVPDGVTIRNMILLVEAWRESDGAALTHTGQQTVHELGGIGDPSLGYYAGLPGKLFAKVNHDSRGKGPSFFTEATGILWDNRIAALAADTSSYRFDIGDGSDVYHVRARLIYRRAFRFLTDAKGWTEDGHGNPLDDVQAPYYGYLMEEDDWISGPGNVSEPPAGFEMHQNFPNPFNPFTTIEYDLANDSNVILRIFNLLGQEVRTLVNGNQTAGYKSAAWNGRDNRGKLVGSGIYLYRIEAGNRTIVKKMSLIR